jgi:hypothetical protein
MSNDEKVQQILSLVKDYIDEKKSERVWHPGVDLSLIHI